METYNRNRPITVKLDASSTDRIITVFENKPEPDDAAYLRNADHVILNGFIKTFRATSILNSIPEAQLPNFSVELSRAERLSRTRNVEWTQARKELQLYLAETPNNWFPIAKASLLNIPPYRMIDLMEYFTSNLAIELGSTGAIGVSIVNAGYGLLGPTDSVYIHGSATTEVVVIPRELQPINQCTPYGWTVGTVSQVLMGAMEGRKQITLTNTGPGKIYINVGGDAVLGEGITLMPNGGSYEFNRTNYPFSLALHAIATEASQLSGLVCV